jgi:MOSC domain-containing protein YiiM
MPTLDLFSPTHTVLPTVVSLHRSNGGVPKVEIPSARVSTAGIEGDRQRNLKYHGGPDRALCLYSLDLIEALQAEGHPVAPGTMGENVVIRGIPWDRMVAGVKLRLGEVEIELTTFAHPCRNIRQSFRGGRIERVSPKTHPGWSRIYARVLKPGLLSPKDHVLFL